MGLFGTELTDFSESCYELYELSNIWYEYEGCPYPLLEYYDGFALGMQIDYYDGTAYEIGMNCPEFYYQNVRIYFCP